MPDDKVQDLDVKQSEDSSTTRTDVKDTTESSNVEKAEEKTLEQVVEDAAKASVEQQAKLPTQAETKEEPEDEVEDKENEDASSKTETTETQDKGQTQEEKDALLPFGKHPRFQELVKEKNEYAEEVKKLKPEVERVKSIDEYCQKNGITEQEFTDALNIVALLKKDPRAARTKLNEFVETIDVTLGDRLPSDVQKKVDDGIIDLESAKELAQARLKARSGEFQAKSAEQRYAEEQNRIKVEAITSWQASKQAGDPDFQKKYDLIQDRFVFLLNTKPPQTPAQAVALAEESYKYVNEKLGLFVPKPKAKKALTTNGSSIQKDEEFVMKSLDDIGKVVDLVMAKHRV